METLGSKLKKIIDAKNAEELRIAMIKEEAARHKAVKERADIQALVDRIMNALISAIELGKIPSFSIRSYNQQRVIKHFMDNPKTAKNYDIWDGMVKFFLKNQCEVVVQHQHDGGDDSWLDVVLNPINE